MMLPWCLLLIATAFAEEYCSLPVDRDVKIMVNLDGLSENNNVQKSLAYIADGLLEIDEWVSEARQELLVSMIQTGMPWHTDTWCTNNQAMNKNIAAIHKDLGSMPLITYWYPRNLMTAAMLWTMRFHWGPRERHSERRIYLLATSQTPELSDIEFVMDIDQSFRRYCPISSTRENAGTLSQSQSYIRGNGIAIYGWLWAMADEEAEGVRSNFKTWLDQVGVTDYYIDAHGPSDLSDAKELFVAGAKTLICTSWIRSTTTYYPSGPAHVVENCINMVYAQMGYAIMSDQTEFKKRLQPCVHWASQYEYKCE